MSETKLAEENSESQEPTPYTVFTLAIESPATKEKYLQRLEYLLNFADIKNKRSIEIRRDIMAARSKSNLNWLNNTIYGYLQHLKVTVDTREISGATLRNYIKPIKLFFQQIGQKFHSIFD